MSGWHKHTDAALTVEQCFIMVTEAVIVTTTIVMTTILAVM